MYFLSFLLPFSNVSSFQDSSEAETSPEYAVEHIPEKTFSLLIQTVACPRFNTVGGINVSASELATYLMEKEVISCLLEIFFPLILYQCFKNQFEIDNERLLFHIVDVAIVAGSRAAGDVYSLSRWLNWYAILQSSNDLSTGFVLSSTFLVLWPQMPKYRKMFVTMARQCASRRLKRLFRGNQ